MRRRKRPQVLLKTLQQSPCHTKISLEKAKHSKVFLCCLNSLKSSFHEGALDDMNKRSQVL